MEDRRRRKMHPRKRNDRAIEYECTRRENKGEHYVKKDKYFYKKNDIFEITSDVKKIVEESGVKEGTCVVYTPHTTAAIVYNSGVNLVAIGLDVATHFDVNLTENDIAALDKSDKMEAGFLR